ncbi:nucleotide exchange factor GrpE [Mumia sp. zg.B17]|uniref:nucleotide exchange factor GrpE n=1 Tax=unclassified Mumia TaxID=2621872 RepID=UPI001C6F267C|nr:MULTISPECIES: nucleotide exchange factor GrpE [unclassified Mumia]MBW9204401.1 nucleotide exchange factor GrpE [Mumia sp. zg.B17]MBW9209614.1 nucleotide exchange factor GrpE [Mumia sp. zg.B21]MDD9348360.1 nucleotide exchange factor GrpE [Mumia sp.]
MTNEFEETVEPEQETPAPAPGPADAQPEVAGASREGGEDDLARQLAERTADLQRLQAEYVNYKRRVDRDREAQRLNATAAVLVSFLPVLDDIGRARDHGELEGGFKAVADSLVQATSAHGLEPFGAPGDVFDPMLHEALMHRLDADAPEGEPTVDAIMQVGYRIGDKVLRPARVSVVEHDDTPVAEADEDASQPATE